jgi:hypothetical protein
VIVILSEAKRMEESRGSLEHNATGSLDFARDDKQEFDIYG